MCYFSSAFSGFREEDGHVVSDQGFSDQKFNVKRVKANSPGRLGGRKRPQNGPLGCTSLKEDAQASRKTPAAVVTSVVSCLD